MQKHGRAGEATDNGIIRRMRVACWIPKSIDTHSEYVILIAFARREWLSEHASMLRYTRFCIVMYNRVSSDHSLRHNSLQGTYQAVGLTLQGGA
jgi:hypothetical protein